MTNRINLLPYRDAKRKAANQQFGVMALLSGGLALALVLSAHGVTAGYLLAQDSRNDFISAENKGLDGQIEEIKQLKGEIDQLKARKDVIEMLQSDRASAVRILEQMVRLAPEGLYLKNIKQQGLKLTMTGLATSNEIVANFLGAIGSSQVLQKPELVEIKSSLVGTRRFSEFNLTAELIRVQKDQDASKGNGKSAVKADAKKTLNASSSVSSASQPATVGATLAGPLAAAKAAAVTAGKPPAMEPSLQAPTAPTASSTTAITGVADLASTEPVTKK